jgi:transcriptional regulator with XRE-family HTH domain
MVVATLRKSSEFSYENFASLIRDLLISTNQRSLAKQLKVSQGTISLWNTGQIRNEPPRATQLAIAKLKGWSPEQLDQYLYPGLYSEDSAESHEENRLEKMTVTIAVLNDQDFDQFSRSLLEQLSFERISKLAAASIGQLQKKHNNVVNPRTKNSNSVERQKLQQLVRQCLVKNNWKIEDFAEEADISLDTAKSIYYQGEIPSEITGEDLILLMGDLASVLVDPKTGHHFRDDITLARYIGIEVIEEGDDDEDEYDDFDDHLTNGNGNSNGHHLNGV